MNRISKTALASLIGLAICAASSLRADTVTVVNNGAIFGTTVDVNLSWIPYSGGVYAAPERLTINGVDTYGYCIDLNHFSGSGTFTVNPLDLSPTATPPGAMGAVKADLIREMWAEYYATSLHDPTLARDFQLAIWGVVQGTVSGGVVTPNWSWLTTSGVNSGAIAEIAWANGGSYALADVVGLNAYAPPGNQAYAIPGVPDGGLTAALLGMGMLGLGWVRRMTK